MTAWLSQLHVQLQSIRRALLTLAILFLTVMLLEVDLGHAPALAHHSLTALIPVVWLPVTLAALMVVDIKPSTPAVIAALVVNVIAAGVGMIGSGLHMQAAGVDLAHLDRVFSSSVWGGRESPNWPVAITLAAVFGMAGTLGAFRSDERLPRDLSGVAAAAAYLLIVAGVACTAVPGLTMAATSCLAAAALLLLAVLIAVLTGTAMERSVP